MVFVHRGKVVTAETKHSCLELT